MIRLVRYITLVFVIALAGTSSAPAAEPADLLLVLASDVSGSVDFAKFKLQRDGYASAITDPAVIKAMTAGVHGRIGLTFLEWAGAGQQKIVIDWAMIDGPESAGHFADLVRTEPRSFSDRTSISAAIDFALSDLDHAPFEAGRRTIDVSGDGTNNAGGDVGAARDKAVALKHRRLPSGTGGFRLKPSRTSR